MCIDTPFFILFLRRQNLITGKHILGGKTLTILSLWCFVCRRVMATRFLDVYRFVVYCFVAFLKNANDDDAMRLRARVPNELSQIPAM